MSQSRAIAAGVGNAPIPPDNPVEAASEKQLSASGNGPRKLVVEDGANYFWAGATENTTSDSGFADVTVANPYLAPGDYHTLAEIWTSSADGKSAVELGWMVDPELFRDSATHVFADIWVDGAFQGYDTDYTTVADSSCNPGIGLQTGTQQSMGIQQDAGYWWIEFGDQWCGAFSDSLWNNAFTTDANIQWYGEVAANENTSNPCTDMGNSLWPSSSSAANFSGIGLFVGPNDAEAAPSFTTYASSPGLYSRQTVSSTEFRFGGPGGC